MGLDYLNKKVWHPGSMKNIQKVWDAQQAQLQVIKKQKERAKKLQDQQYNEDMKRIQVQAGLIPRSHLDRMDWMYDWGNKLQQQKNSQEFLTGQKKANKKQVKHIFQQQATNRKCQDFVLIHEDPMYAIQRQQMKARQSIMNNPMQMKSIIQEVQQDYLRLHKKNKQQRKSKNKDSNNHKVNYQKATSTEKTNSQKNKKQKRKHKRQGGRSSSSSISSSSSSSSSSSRQRSRKNKKNSKIYENYLKQKFGNILKKDEQGNLVPDYGMHKKKYKTQFQLNEDERREKIYQMRENAKKLRKQERRSPSPNNDYKKDFEQGISNIRQKSFQNYSQKKYSKYD